MADRAKLFSAYVPHERVQLVFGKDDVSLTRQEFADESDINKIMARYEKTGVWPMAQPGQEPQYLDVSDVPDFRAAMDFVAEANSAFMRLPATVRREFDNDPAAFVDFAQKDENADKMREWGLAAPLPEPPAPQEVAIVEDRRKKAPREEPPTQ